MGSQCYNLHVNFVQLLFEVLLSSHQALHLPLLLLLMVALPCQLFLGVIPTLNCVFVGSLQFHQLNVDVHDCALTSGELVICKVVRMCCFTH